MDNITLGHWIFALIGSGTYILYCLWEYKKEYSLYKQFNYHIKPVVLYVAIILMILVLVS